MKHQLECLGLFVLTFLATGTIQAAESPKADEPVRQAILGAVAARLEALGQIEVEYDVEQVFSTSMTAPTSAPAVDGVQAPGGASIMIRRGTERFSERFFFLSGRARWESIKSRATVEAEVQRGILSVVERVRTYVDGAMEQLDVRVDQSLGSVDPIASPPPLHAVDLGLGLRNGEDGPWMTAQSLQTMTLAQDERGLVVLNGRNKRGQMLDWVLDPSKGYAPVVYRRHSGKIQGYSEFIAEEVTCGDFRSVNGILLPHLIIRQYFHYSGRVTQQWRATVHKYVLNGPDNTPDRYYIRWPKGMTVIDRRTGNVFRINREGQTLTEATLSEATLRPTASTRPTGGPPQLVRWSAPMMEIVEDEAGSNESRVFIVVACAVAIAVIVWRLAQRRVSRNDGKVR